MDTIKNLIRLMFAWWTAPIAGRRGSKKLNKMIKKNKKMQDPNLYPFEERYKYARKKAAGISKRAGVKVVVDGIDNLPKGAAWIVANHTSNFDGVWLLDGIGHKLEIVPIVRDDVKKSRMASGYFNGLDAMFLDRTSPRQALQLLEGAAQYGKNKNRAIVIFPEGTRSLTGELLDFKNGSFKFPQKYFLPIVPITILGTLEARVWWKPKTRIVTLKIGKTIKAIEHSKIPTDILGNRIRNEIKNNINDWNSKLSKSEKEYHEKLVKKSKASMDKKTAKLAKQGIKIN